MLLCMVHQAHAENLCKYILLGVVFTGNTGVKKFGGSWPLLVDDFICVYVHLEGAPSNDLVASVKSPARVGGRYI